MARAKKFIAAAVLIAVVLLFASFWRAGIDPPVSVSAAVFSDFEILSYDAVYDLAADRTVRVSEEITVRFRARRQGIVRDFPLGGGVRYAALTVGLDGSPLAAFTRDDDGGVLSVCLGTEGVYLAAGSVHVYTLGYTMSVPALGEEGSLPLDALGYGWSAPVGELSVTVNCPEGLEDYTVVSGAEGTERNDCNAVCKREGNVLTLAASGLPAYAGVTVGLRFGAGVLSAAPDDSYLYAGAVALALLAVFLAGVLACRPPLITRTVNLSAPEDMDPLLMGKIIDNAVDPEDFGALVFWFASKGYLRIDLSGDAEDPLLIRTEKPLPDTLAPYLRTFFGGLFAHSDCTRVSELRERFYATEQAVRVGVADAAGQLYRRRGWVFAGVLAALCILLFGGFGLLYSALTTFSAYRYFSLFPLCAAAFAIPAVGSFLASMRKFKWKRAACFFTRFLTYLAGCAVFLFSVSVPSPAFTFYTALLCVLASATFGMLSGFLLTRTEAYSARLGQILGFRDFLLYTEKDRVKYMLEEDPAFYYDILPYAQVLGVTDAWTEKFRDLTVAPPDWARIDAADTLFTALVWSATFRTLSVRMARDLASRPATHGHGFGGGGFGGFGGGGFGGGGGRSF